MRIQGGVHCGNAIAPDGTLSGDAAEDSSFGNRRSRQPAVHRGLDPIGHRDGADVGGLAHQIHNGPMFFPLLQVIESQAGHFTSAQSATEKEKEEPFSPKRLLGTAVSARFGTG